jgi:hypothetical protein
MGRRQEITMNKTHTLTWAIRGFALTCLILVLVVMLTLPALGLASNSKDPGDNREAQVYDDESPSVIERDLDGETAGSGYTSPLVIPAADFSSDGGFPDDFFFDFEYGYLQGDGFACLKAPVYLPDGVTVTSVNASLYDNASGNVVVELRRVNVTTGTVDVMANPGTFADSTDIQHPNDVFIYYPEVSYPEYAYFLTTCLSSPSHRLYSVRIYYTGP